MAEQKNEMVTKDTANIEHYRRSIKVTPPVDIYENEDEILLVSDLPGVKSDRLDINLDNNTLTIEGRRMLESFDAASSETNDEIDYYRVFTVPQGVDANKINAKLNDGVLTLHLPKSPAMKPRRISITTG